MNSPVRVKFIGNYSAEAWKRQFPKKEFVWGQCEYIFDVDETEYDWLVVYNDLPAERLVEPLSCNLSKTLLVTMEPSSIKVYGRSFTAQFGNILTSQPDWALPHPGRIYSQSGLQWFYGVGKNHLVTYDEMMASPPLHKTKILSTVCSTKQQRHTLHHKRYRFTQALKERLPYLDIYGHGVKQMDDKAEALEHYKYHIAIENYVGPHHWTEKLSDVFLGAALPFYYGCTNLNAYFPEGSYIPIDINDVDGSANIIQQAIDDNQYEKRLPQILEARKRILEEYNLFAVLARVIESRNALGATLPAGGEISSRRILRSEKPLTAIWDLLDKTRNRVLYFLKNR